MKSVFGGRHRKKQFFNIFIETDNGPMGDPWGTGCFRGRARLSPETLIHDKKISYSQKFKNWQKIRNFFLTGNDENHFGNDCEHVLNPKNACKITEICTMMKKLVHKVSKTNLTQISHNFMEFCANF